MPVLKNVGAICNACGAGRHYDCILLTDPRKKMCLCAYATHPYLSKDQLAKPLSVSAAVPMAGGTELIKQGVGKTVLRTEAKAPVP